MRIALLSYYNGLAKRGTETFIHELATGLVRHGIDVDVYQNGKAEAGIGYSVKYLPSVQSLPSFTTPPDILLPANGRLQAIAAKYWSLSHKKKMVISGQSGIGWDDRLNLYTFPDIFVGLTDFQCGWAKKVNPAVRVIKVPNGVDNAKFHPRVTPLEIDLPHPIVLYTAAFESIKRHHLLIQAVAKTPASLLLVGQGSLEQPVANLAAQSLGQKRYRILSVPYSQMPGVYTAADLFAYPTAPWESFGIAILEALASGLPVVATDDPIRKEIIGDAGLLVDPTDQEKFATAIGKGLKQDWQDLPQKQAQKFTWDKITEEYAELFSRLLP